MFRFPRWKIASIIAMSLLAFLVIVPSFLAKDVRENIAKKLPAWFPFYSVVLGLDLQGGAHILLEVDAADVARTQVEALRDDVRRILREERIRITGGIGGSGRTVQVRVPDAAERQKAVVRLRQQAPPNAANALGITSPPTFEVRESPDGLVQLVLSDSAILDRVRRAVDQTIEDSRSQSSQSRTRVRDWLCPDTCLKKKPDKLDHACDDR